MAWLGSATATNRIDDTSTEYEESIWYGGQTWTRTITVDTYRWVGMTLAAADAQVTSISNPPDLIASRKRGNAAGSYTVEATETTTAAWAV